MAIALLDRFLWPPNANVTLFASCSAGPYTAIHCRDQALSCHHWVRHCLIIESGIAKGSSNPSNIIGCDSYKNLRMPIWYDPIIPFSIFI